MAMIISKLPITPSNKVKLEWNTQKLYFLVCKKKKPVDFDDELKIGDVRYDNIIKITIKVQLFWRLPYET